MSAVMPHVNLNGTCARELFAQQSKKLDAFRAALEAHCAAAPHGRDYRSTEEYKAARREYDMTHSFLTSEIRMINETLEYLAEGYISN